MAKHVWVFFKLNGILHVLMLLTCECFSKEKLTLCDFEAMVLLCLLQINTVKLTFLVVLISLFLLLWIQIPPPSHLVPYQLPNKFELDVPKNLVSVEKDWDMDEVGNCLQDPIDVVYTWVNGSDEKFMSLKRKLFEKHENKNFRFDYDWNTLQFSLRSVEMYVPWIRNIYIVTNGQVPKWLNSSAPGIKIITHEEIFDSNDVLPTFNSNAIELYIHRIQGLSSKFLFLNDDVFLGQPVLKEDFCHEENGQKIFFEQAMEIELCQDGCLNSWLGDSVCHLKCDNSACLYDRGDCSNKTFPISEKAIYAGNDQWYQSLANWNSIFNVIYGFEKRFYVSHQILFMDKVVKEEFNRKFQSQVLETSTHQFRTGKDVQLQFTYVYFLMGERKLRSKILNSAPPKSRFKFKKINNSNFSGMNFINTDPEEVKKSFDERKVGKLPMFYCINDNTGDTMKMEPQKLQELQNILSQFLKQHFPNKSKYEI